VGQQSGRGPDERVPSRPSATADQIDVIRSEEELHATKQTREAGRLRVRKVVEDVEVAEELTRKVEHAEVTRVPASPDDSGEVERLDDGSLSIPVLAEELVVQRRTVVRERILVRKITGVETEPIRDTLRRERIEIDAPGDLRDRLDVATGEDPGR
jgi:uncharacterized protein (TIGR02271 family)